MQKVSRNLMATVASALSIGAGDRRYQVTADGGRSPYQQPEPKGYMPTIRVAGCKGAKSMSVAANRRAATKRNNKRKNHKGAH